MRLGPILFNEPQWLLLLPLALVAILLISRKTISGLSSISKYISLSVRILVIALVTGALAEPQLRREAEAVNVVVVVDESDSVPDDARQEAVEYITQLAKDQQPNDGVGLVTVGRFGTIQALPGDFDRADSALEQLLLQRGYEITATDGTDLADGVERAMSLLSPSAATRVVVISDGNETQGSVLGAARAAQAAGVPVDVIPTKYDVKSEVILESLVTPPTARVGQTIDVRFVLRATRATTGKLSMLVNGAPFDLSPGEPGLGAPVTLQEGSTIISSSVQVTGAEPYEFRAVYEPDRASGDAITQNNTALSVTHVASDGGILMFAPDTVASMPLATSLRQSELRVDVRHPSQGFRSLEELQAYDAVILFDTPSYHFSRLQQAELASYVHDSGGGLVMVGGPDSFGAGGWSRTPVADALPVDMEPPSKRQMPRGALVLVIDASGSMGSHVSGTNMNQSDAANEAAIAAIDTLSRLDHVAVLSFDTQVRVAVPLQPRGDQLAINQRIRSIAPGGGTDMFPAIRQGIEILENAPGSVGHMIVLSDGQTMDDGSLNALLARAQNKNITISTVSIGDGSNDPLMQQMSKATGGEWYGVNAAGGLAKLPQLFIKEAQTIRRTLLWEGDPFSPQITALSDGLRGLSSLPPLTGYVVTGEREGLALTTVRGQEGDPVVAQWQHGLGRSLAFTSDAAARWSRNWVSWGSYSAFWAQHMRWVMRPSGSSNVGIVTESDGERTTVIATVLDSEGDPLNFARMRGRVTHRAPDGRATAKTINLVQTGPGRYEGSIDSADPGSYQLALRYDGADASGERTAGVALAAVTRPFADEYRALRDNTPLLERLADLTGGRIIDFEKDTITSTAIEAAQDNQDEQEARSLFSRLGLTMPAALTPVWIEIALIACSLFLLDVGVRRVRIDLTEIAGRVRSAMGIAQHKSESQIAAMRAAKDAAAARTGTQSATAVVQQAKQDTQQAAQQKTSQRAAKRFVASEQQLRAADTTADSKQQTPPAAPISPSSQAQQDNADQEEAGMSRLLRAKQRARQQLDDD